MAQQKERELLDACLWVGTDYTAPPLLDSVSVHHLRPSVQSWTRPGCSRPLTPADQSMQTKRLHISGLTPAISEQDIYSRFSVFGTVKAVNGFGQLNAVGQPRNFAFLSLEATPDKVSKCKLDSLRILAFSLIGCHRLERFIWFDMERHKTQNWRCKTRF